MIDTSSDLLSRLRATLSDIKVEPDEVLLQTALNEAWFSNVLAWLLNPKGTHGLGVAFCKAFVGRVAQRRVEARDGLEYARKATFLKWGKEGLGVGATNFAFQNAAVLREYYLSKPADGRADRRGGFCDIVLLDLDTKDSFFLAIENKLFTSDRHHQLRQYREAIDEKYQSAGVRELVYLTVQGDSPVGVEDDDPDLKNWVRLSWTSDILDILRCAMQAITGDVHPQIRALTQLLEWLKQVTDLGRVPLVKEFRKRLLRSAAECLFEELTRLDAPMGGQWKLEPSSDWDRPERISYTVRTASYLTIELLPGLAVTVQGRQYSGKADFDKIVVPFGAHPDQIMNLLDIAARDVYHNFFEPDSLNHYLGSCRRLRTTVTEKEREHRPVFQFVHDYRFALKPMLLQSHDSRAAVGIQDEVAAEAQ